MKPNVIVVVGPDMTGKTQIAKALARRTGLPYFKAKSEHDTYLNNADKFVQQLKYADTRLVDFLKQTGAPVVMDRGWPCEYVYSRVLQRATDHEVLAQVDEEMAKLGAKVVVCVRKKYDGIVDDLDPKLDSKKLQELTDAYYMFVAWTRCQCKVLEVDDEDLDREIEEILQWLGHPVDETHTVGDSGAREPTLDWYQEAAQRSAEKSGNIAVLGLGLAGEAGEVAEHIKKHVGHGHELDRDKIVKELGDVLWYVAVTAKRVGASLNEVARVNVEKLLKRYPDGFSSNASKNRSE